LSASPLFAGGWNLAPLTELLWIFLVMAPATLLVLGALGNYGPLLYPSRTRIVLGSFLAPLAGLSLARDRRPGCLTQSLMCIESVLRRGLFSRSGVKALAGKSA
jgi:hypothetical protein